MPSSPNVTRQRFGKHDSAETNTHATIQEQLDACFLCSPCYIKYSICGEKKVSQLYFSQSCETVKFVRESHGNLGPRMTVLARTQQESIRPEMKGKYTIDFFLRTLCLVNLLRSVRHEQLTQWVRLAFLMCPIEEVSPHLLIWGWNQIQFPKHCALTEYYMVDKFQKLGNTDCTVPSAQPFTI